MLRITPKSFNKSYKPTNIHQFQPKSYSFQSAKYTDFNSRERALEDSTVYKHERETLKKLREKLGFDAKQDHEDEVKAPQQTQQQQYYQSQSQLQSQNNENFSLNDFLVFRKEMIEKVRNLEDEVIALKYKVNNLTKRN